MAAHDYWALEYKRERREIRILFNEREIGRVKCSGVSIMTEAELEAHNERLVRTTLEMAADQLRSKASACKAGWGALVTLGQHYWCDGVEAGADEIDPRRGTESA